MAQCSNPCARCHTEPRYANTTYCVACKRILNQEARARRTQREHLVNPPKPATADRLCSLCGTAPRNSSNKSYCVDCKRIKDIEGNARRTEIGRKPSENCSMCGKYRDGRHPSYCVSCNKEYKAGRLLAPCSKCGEVPAPGERTNTSYCRSCTRNWWLKHNYGITSAEYDRMLVAQDNRCALCYCEANGRTWHVDHDHLTKVTRKILCDNCNRGLGHLQDDPIVLRRAADYIEEFRFLAMLFSE
jgi:hypothetical protein